MTLRVAYRDETDRLFNGLVRRVVALNPGKYARTSYLLHVVPRLWFLRQTIDCRIFQRQRADEILKTIFDEQGIEDVEFNIHGDNPVRPYTTQYNETDLDFCNRIIQESGWFYFFVHSEGHHRLTIADSNQVFPYQPDPEHSLVIQGNNRDVFADWRESHETAYGRVTLQDRDPEKPRSPVTGKEKAYRPSPGWSERSVYRWPAMTIDRSVAADRARFHIESSEAAASLNYGLGFDPNLCAGFRFTLVDRLITGTVTRTRDYVVQEVTHEIVDDTGHVDGTTVLPKCQFTCFPLSVQWRDPVSIPRPTMAGIFSGIVLGDELGADAEETCTDHLARIKVQPFFNHDQFQDDGFELRAGTMARRSIFVRILHPWSGDRWGWQHLPRVGTEVGLAFMNGDPDEPVVAGCFYHDDNLPVFPLTDHQTRQGFRSRKPSGAMLTGDGSAQLGFGDFNELSFEGKTGAEEVFINAHRDLYIFVNNETIIVNKTGSITVRSPTDVTLQVGPPPAIPYVEMPPAPSSIVMTPENISITSPTLTMNAGETKFTFGVTSITTGDLNMKTGATQWGTAAFNLTTLSFSAQSAAWNWMAAVMNFITADANFTGVVTVAAYPPIP